MNNPKKTALILVDFEKEWITPTSEYYLCDLTDVIEKTNHLIDYARSQQYKIIFTIHIEKETDEAFAEDSDRIEIIDGLHKQAGDVLIKKYKISPFFETNLAKELEGIEHLIVCGLLTNLCVRSTVHDAYDRDFDITIVTDCCKAFDQDTHEFTLKDLKETREDIHLMGVEDVVSS